jgi:TonB family protein
MIHIKNITATGFKIVIISGINLLLFLVIPVVSNLFNTLPGRKDEVKNQPRIIAEIRKPKQQEKKQQKQRTRKVQTSGGKQEGSRMNFKFTPDLGIANGEGVGIQTRQDMEAMVFEEGETDEAAVPVAQPPIPYPDQARKAGVEGELEIIFVVDRDGKLGSIEFPRSPDPVITNAARKALEEWRFKPAKNKGIPVRVKMKVIVEFKLDTRQ